MRIAKPSELTPAAKNVAHKEVEEEGEDVDAMAMEDDKELGENPSLIDPDFISDNDDMTDPKVLEATMQQVCDAAYHYAPDCDI